MLRDVRVGRDRLFVNEELMVVLVGPPASTAG
jgi:hypothetical protein